MIYQGIAILILVTFYSFYIAKLVVQKKQDIKTNQMGVGNKPKKVLFIERIMSLATVLVCMMEVGSRHVASSNSAGRKSYAAHVRRGIRSV